MFLFFILFCFSLESITGSIWVWFGLGGGREETLNNGITCTHHRESPLFGAWSILDTRGWSGLTLSVHTWNFRFCSGGLERGFGIVCLQCEWFFFFFFFSSSMGVEEFGPVSCILQGLFLKRFHFNRL